MVGSSRTSIGTGQTTWKCFELRLAGRPEAPSAPEPPANASTSTPSNCAGLSDKTIGEEDLLATLAY